MRCRVFQQPDGHLRVVKVPDENSFEASISLTVKAEPELREDEVRQRVRRDGLTEAVARAKVYAMPLLRDLPFVDLHENDLPNGAAGDRNAWRLVDGKVVAKKDKETHHAR